MMTPTSSKPCRPFCAPAPTGVATARDGEAALELVRKRQPDLLVLDLLMPKKDGFAVIRELRADPETTNLPILVLTTVVEDASRRRYALETGREHGGAGLPSETGAATELLRVVAELLEKVTRHDLPPIALSARCSSSAAASPGSRPASTWPSRVSASTWPSRRPAIGGHMAQLDKTFPTNDCAMCTISPKLVDAGRHPNIDLLVDTEVAAGRRRRPATSPSPFAASRATSTRRAASAAGIAPRSAR